MAAVSTAALDAVIKILNETNPDKPAQEKWRLEEIERSKNVAKYRRYILGDQDSGLNDRMRKLLNLEQGQDFNFNNCAKAVHSISDRLQVIDVIGDVGRKAPNRTGQAEASKLWVSEIRDWNYFDDLQVQLYEAVFRDDVSYVMVGWDDVEQMPVLTLEKAFDGTAGMLVISNRKDESIIDLAIKVWHETLDASNDLMRVNFYYPDRVEKYKVVNNAFEPYSDPDRPNEPVQPWTDRQGAAIGVPVIRFNGTNKLRDIVPLQHGINAIIHSMVGTAMLGAFPINVVFGFSAPENVEPGLWIEIVPKDKDGKRMTPTPELAEYFKMMRVDQLKSAGMTEYISTIKFFENAIEKVGNIPNNNQGANESGESRKQRESDLLAECRRAQVWLGNSWEQVFQTAAAVQTAYGDAAPVVRRWRVIWKDPQTRNDLEQAQVLTALAKYFEGSDEMLRQSAALLDLTPERVEEIKQEQEKNKSAMTETILARMPGYGTNRTGVQPVQQQTQSQQPPALTAGAATNGA